ncbi:MAG: hypothetical protein IJ261_03010 [Clostridia bacterium]|nr:hypothetical protein [Clostridia bacterium]
MKTFLFQGDSVTDAGRNREDDFDLGPGYPRMVAEYFEKKYPELFSFVNTGTSGDTSACIYARMGTEILNINPDYMSLLVGFNDISHLINKDDGIASHRYEQLLCMLIEDVTEALPGIKIIMLEPYVLKGVLTETNWNELNPGVRNNAAIAKRVAEKYGLPFVRLQDKFDALCNEKPADFWLQDGIHPTENGHRVIAGELIRAIEETAFHCV